MLKKYFALLCFFQISSCFESDHSDLLEYARFLKNKSKIIARKIKDVENTDNKEQLVVEYVECFKEQWETLKAAGVLVPVQQENPELFALCNTIKQDLGITDTIHFYIDTTYEYLENYRTGAEYVFTLGDAIVFNKKFLKIQATDMHKSDICKMLYFIAHELGHYLQFHNDVKSYQSLYQSLQERLSVVDDLYEVDLKKLEIAAEANAFAYFDCSHCLTVLSEKYGDRLQYDLENGYYGLQDIQLFIQRAKLDGQLCRVHSNGQAFLSNDNNKLQDFKLVLDECSTICNCQDCLQEVLQGNHTYIGYLFMGLLEKEILQEKLEQAKATGKRCNKHSAEYTIEFNYIVSNNDFLRKILEARYINLEEQYIKDELIFCYNSQLFADKYAVFKEKWRTKEATYTVADFLPQKDRSLYQKPYLESKLDSGDMHTSCVK